MIQKFKDFFKKKQPLPPVEKVPTDLCPDWVKCISSLEMDFRFKNSSIGQKKANTENDFFDCLQDEKFQLNTLFFRDNNTHMPAHVRNMDVKRDSIFYDQIESFRQSLIKYIKSDTSTNMERIIMILDDYDIKLHFEQICSDGEYWPYVRVIIGSVIGNQMDESVALTTPEIMYRIYKMVVEN
jgi:hypothetical protein